MSALNLHATAIVIATTGYLFIGPSGIGKTSTALSCIASARRRGLNAALVADDRVLVTQASGRLVARAPPPIAGLAELRGVGPIPVASVAAAVIGYAVRPVSAPFDERVAPEDEHVPIDNWLLPLLRLPRIDGVDPLDALLRFSAPE